jgi:hypothetical protein
MRSRLRSRSVVQATVGVCSCCTLDAIGPSRLSTPGLAPGIITLSACPLCALRLAFQRGQGNGKQFRASRPIRA